jgi:hypothetical protein
MVYRSCFCFLITPKYMAGKARGFTDAKEKFFLGWKSGAF